MRALVYFIMMMQRSAFLATMRKKLVLSLSLLPSRDSSTTAVRLFKEIDVSKGPASGFAAASRAAVSNCEAIRKRIAKHAVNDLETFQHF